MERPWRIELLGGLHVVHCGRDLSRFGTQRAASLLAYLAYHLGRAHPRLELIELLWPGEAPEAGREILSTALYRLRQQLAPLGSGSDLVIVSDRADVRLNPDLVTTDVAEFEATITPASRDGGRPAGCPVSREADRRAEQTERWARAVELYRGPLLPAFHEDWVLQEREWMAERYFQALRQLLTDLEELGEHERALEYARCGVKADPLREEAHQGLIRLLAKAGQPSAARLQYQELERLLEQHLGATPTAATRRLCQEIERLADRRPTTDDRRPPTGAGVDTTYLPNASGTSVFVGETESPTDHSVSSVVGRRSGAQRPPWSRSEAPCRWILRSTWFAPPMRSSRRRSTGGTASFWSKVHARSGYPPAERVGERRCWRVGCTRPAAPAPGWSGPTCRA